MSQTTTTTGNAVLVVVLLLWCCIAVAAADELADGVVEWIRSQGGYFNPKLEIRGGNVDTTVHKPPNDDDNDTSSSSPPVSLGVFAKQDIAPHEPLLFVPQAAYIRITDPVPVNETDEEATYWYQNYCQLAQQLQHEMSLQQGGNDASAYAPYIRYLQHQPTGQVPATWSRAGKDLLRTLLPAGHDGVDWINERFRKTGCISSPAATESSSSSSSAVQEHTVALTIQRGYDRALVPIWDMFNHKNGYVNTENDSIWAPDGLHVRAAGENIIAAGQELYATYDKCVDCGNIWWYWGTPEILRDFGFVEDYRQRWVFYEHGIWFELDYHPDSGELEVLWDLKEQPDDESSSSDTTTSEDEEEEDEEEQAYGVPDDKAVAFLKSELARLKSAEPTLFAESATKLIPQHEHDTIVRYHRAATVAMSMAIKAATAYHTANNNNNNNTKNAAEGSMEDEL